jgi:hypothetical protein
MEQTIQVRLLERGAIVRLTKPLSISSPAAATSTRLRSENDLQKVPPFGDTTTMSWARVIVVAAALTACKSSHSNANEGGAASQSAAAGSAIEMGAASAAPPARQGAEPETALGSAGGSPLPARPLSSSLYELERVTPLPEIEGEPAIAVFVERVSGGLMPDIEHATSRLRAGMRACYLRSVDDDAPDAARLALRIVVSTNGSVKSVRADGASDIDASAVDCMIRRAETATFPPPVGEPAEIVLRIAFLPPRLRQR